MTGLLLKVVLLSYLVGIGQTADLIRFQATHRRSSPHFNFFFKNLIGEKLLSVLYIDGCWRVEGAGEIGVIKFWCWRAAEPAADKKNGKYRGF